MAGAKKKTRGKTGSRRRGVPLIVYLEERQATQLEDLSQERRITKTAIVKFAVDRLFLELSDGQLDLPLGLESTVRK